MSTRSGRRMPPPERIYIRIVLQEGRISSKTINRPAAACLSRLGVLFTPVEYYERMQIDAYYILSISMTGTVQYGLRRCISSPPPGRLSKLRQPTKRVPRPNDASSESARRDFSNAGLFLAPALFRLLLCQVWRYRPWKIGPGLCDKTRSHTVLLQASTVRLKYF